MKRDIPHILLVNPWIHDFAAYDFWAKPYGLLMLAAILRHHGCKVSYIDCLNRFHPEAPKTDPYLRHGRGPYIKTRIQKPKGMDDIPRNYSRYGIYPEWFRKDLLSIPQPDVILVTSLMTYWYPGVFETINFIKQIFPTSPIILGGIYASLCEDHARRFSAADYIVTGPGEDKILDIIKTFTDWTFQTNFDCHDMNSYPYPAFDLQTVISYIPILTSRGCPYSCAYCASHVLFPNYQRRSPDHVFNEIQFWHHKFGIKDFVFYDDALLVHSSTHAIPLFEKILASGIQVFFHTPNAVHIREINQVTANLMYQVGFKHIRLGLETTSFENRNYLDHKVTIREFQQAIAHLKAAGFTKDQIGAYLLVGLPGQSMKSIELSFQATIDAGITPIPTYYSPIPHTKLWKEAVADSRYPLETDPVFTNNAIFPCGFKTFSWDTITRLKIMSHK